MRGAKVGKVNEENLENELFQIVQRTAGRFVNDVERLGRHYRRLRVTTDPGQLRSRVENSLMGLVGGRSPAARRKRNHKPSPKKLVAAGWRDWPEPADDGLGLKIVHTMPHDEGDYKVFLPDDPDSVEVVKGPSFWRRVIQHAIHH